MSHTSNTTRILERLGAIEREEGVRILHACESGSRACGFLSADSDYDVWFIYIRPRDVIEQPIEGDLDING